MTTESIRVSGLIPATPKRVYEAWLDSREHSKFSGGKAMVTPGVGGELTARNGYITGKTLELEPGKRILQSWRTKDFPPDAEDSRLEVILEPRGAGETEISFLHTGIPEGQGHKYEESWVANYLTPMRRYFNSPASQLKPAKPAPAPAAAKPKSAPPPPAPRPAKSALRAKKAAKVTKKAAPKKSAAAKRVAARKGKARPAVKKTAARKAKAKPGKKRPAKKSRR